MHTLDPNSYLYIYPNIPKTVGQIYTNLQASLSTLITTLPKLVNLPGSGPNIGNIFLFGKLFAQHKL